MKTVLLSAITLIVCLGTRAQKIDSIYFHLYTDSLKKGTHNYINVDGKLSNGKWQPMTIREIEFSSSDCTFSGNELVVPADYAGEKITVKAVLKADPSIWKETTIWIKRLPDPESLPTTDEILKKKKKGKPRG